MDTTTGLHYRTAHKWDLTPRQREVLDLVARGYTNAQIGEALGMTLDGAKFHVSEIISKLGLSTREEAAQWWQEKNRPLARLQRLVTPLIAAGAWRVVGAAAGVAAVATVSAAVILSTHGGDDTSTPAAAAAHTVTTSLPFEPGFFTGYGNGGPVGLTLRPNGTFILEGPDTTLAILEGAYVLEGDTLTIDDRAWHSACLSEPEPGVYRWERSPEGALSLTAVDEPCARRERLLGQEWQPR